MLNMLYHYVASEVPKNFLPSLVTVFRLCFDDDFYFSFLPCIIFMFNAPLHRQIIIVLLVRAMINLHMH